MTRDRRRALLVAALGFVQLRARAPELTILHRCLDSWTGLGLIVGGMWRQGYALTLQRYHAGGWAAEFVDRDRYPLDGRAVASTPWTAVQRAAWAVVKRAP